MLRNCRERFEDTTLQVEDGGRGHESRNASNVALEAGKSKEIFYLPEPLEALPNEILFGLLTSKTIGE